MLNGVFQTGERIEGAPAAVLWKDSLWVAYRTLNGMLRLRSASVLQATVVSNAIDTGFPISDANAPSLAATEGMLFVVWQDPTGQVNFTSTADGAVFSPVVALGVSAAPSLTASSSGLWLVYAEPVGGDFGRLHLLQGTSSGNFSEIPLVGVDGAPVRTQIPAAIATDPVDDSVIVAVSSPTFEIRVGRVVPGAVLQFDARAAFIAAEQPLSIQMASTGGHGGARFITAYRFGQEGSGNRVAAHTIAWDLSRTGKIEPGSSGGLYGFGLAGSKRRVWIAWRSAAADSSVDELRIAPYDLIFDLPQDLRDLIGTDCDPLNCPPDPRIVCAPTDDMKPVWMAPRIENARKGDLVLTPADGVGIIGGLLNAVSPRQYYDHMGIMVEDRILIRHATMAHDRAKAERYRTGELFGTKAPTDGFRPDLMRYGWPGTITQTIDDAFYTGWNSFSPRAGAVPNTSLNPKFAWVSFGENRTWPQRPANTASSSEWESYGKKRNFIDPETPEDSYSIHNFPDKPAYNLAEQKLIEGKVVRPDRTIEALQPGLRSLLHRIADEIEKISGHYRFFAYSRSDIALDQPGTPGTHCAPPKGDARWAGLGAGADWCADTVPVACSSFVWAAIQRVSQQGSPQILLELPSTELPEEKPAPIDGLYQYDESERTAAASSLHAYLEQNVRDEVRESLAKVSDKYSFVTPLLKMGMTGILALLQAPFAAVAAVLGVTKSQLSNLVLLFNDMPNQVANQLANIFAFDDAEAVDDEKWQRPGTGTAVSPDDILRFWDPATSSNEEVQTGLYGYSETMLLVAGRWEQVRSHKYGRSAGVASVSGTVSYRGKPIVGAEVRIGCDTDTTRPFRDTAEYYLEVGAQQHEIVAGAYWPQSQWWLSKRETHRLNPGDNRVDIQLEPPPEWRRRFRAFGKLDLVRRVLIGNDDWLHSPVVFEQAFGYFPSDWGMPSNTADVSHRWRWTSGHAGDESVHINLFAKLNQDLSIFVEIHAILLEGYYRTDPIAPEEVDPKDDAGDPMSDEFEAGALENFTVAPGQSKLLKISLKSADTPPDRAWIELTFVNERIPA